MNESRYRWTLIFTASLVPLAMLIYFIFRFHVNVPFGVEWEIAEYLENWDAGRMSLAYLWEQHNEHRIFFPRIILLALAKLTRWDLLYEELLNLSLAVSTYIILAHTCFRLEKWTGRFYMVCLVSTLPSIVFSPRQWENWSWGIQIVVFLSTFAVVAGLAILMTRPVTWRRLFSAIALGVVSQYSFSSGFAYWPAGLGLLWFAVYSGQPRRGQVLAAWCASAAFFSAFYLWGFYKTNSHPTISYCLAHPLEYIGYVLMYLGSLLNIGRGAFAIFLGAVALTFYSVTFGWLYRENKIPRNLLAGAASFGFYAILNALMTGVGRAGFEQGGQALSSRYVTTSYLFWVSVLLLGTLFYHPLSGSGISRVFKLVLRGSQVLIFVGLSLILLRTAFTSLRPWGERYAMLETARAQLLRSEEDEKLLQAISTLSDGDRIRDNIKYIRDKKISLFAE